VVATRRRDGHQRHHWPNDFALSATVAGAMIINGIIAVSVGMLLPIIFARLGRDPAVGTDEITTAVSDNLSMLAYLVMATSSHFGDTLCEGRPEWSPLTALAAPLTGCPPGVSRIALAGSSLPCQSGARRPVK
jgi:hypothetical protein